MQKKYFMALAGLAVGSYFLINSNFIFAETGATNEQENMQAMNATSCGLTPPATQIDNFSELNFENFAPVYAGPIPSEVAPNLSINKTTPIAPSTANLQFTASAAIPHSWIIESNAFYLGTAYTVSVDVRIDPGFLLQSSNVETGLIGAISSYTRYGTGNGTGTNFTSTLDGLRLQHTASGDQVILSANANYTNTGWTGGTNHSVPIQNGLTAAVYTLKMTYNSGEITSATVVNKSTGAQLASFTNIRGTSASAIGMYLNIPAINAITEPKLNFSNVTVQSTTPYTVPANHYVRAPFPNFIVLNRYPDPPLQPIGGDWVGGATGFYDSEQGIYKMWYRQRTATARGLGYAYATSTDGINWTKYNGGNTIFTPTATPGWLSVEKISVLKVQTAPGTYLYQAWYSILPPSADSNGWRVAYAYSLDGINWTDKGIIDPSNTYYKDPVVIRGSNGAYYMYVLYGTGANGVEGIQGSVLTCTSNCASTSGAIPQFATPGTSLWTNSDGHPGVFYAQNSGKYWLFQDNYPSMANASSSSYKGPFSFSSIMNVAAVGLDDDSFDQAGAGVDYAFFMTDENGQLASDQHVLMYYQARHAYLNNPANWQDQQDGKIALAGMFSGYYINIPTAVSGTSLVYSAFPAPAQACATAMATGFSVTPPSGIKFNVNISAWDNSTNATGGAWTIQNSTSTTKTYSYTFSNLAPTTLYALTQGGSTISKYTTSSGTVTFSGLKTPSGSGAVSYSLTKK